MTAGFFDDIPIAQSPPSSAGLFDDIPVAAPLPPARPSALAYNSDALDPGGQAATFDPVPGPRMGQLAESIQARPEMQGPPIPGYGEGMDDATPRTGGSILDRLFGTESNRGPTADLTADQAFNRKQRKEADAQKALDDARAAQNMQAATPSMQQDGLLGGVAAGQDALVKRIELGNQQRAIDSAIGAKVAAGKEQPETQSKTRNIAETTAEAVIGVPKGIGDAFLILSEGANRLLGDEGGTKEIRDTREKFDQALGGLAKGDAARKEEWDTAIAQGFGSTAGFAGAGFVIGKALGLSVSATTALSGALPQASQMYAEAEAKGASELQKWSMFVAGLPLGASEALPIANFLENWNRATGGALRKLITHAAIESFEEGSQETGQQAGENVAMRLSGVDPNRDPMQGVAKGGAVGALTGAGMSVAHGVPALAAEALMRRGAVPAPDTSPVPLPAELQPTAPGPAPAPLTAVNGPDASDIAPAPELLATPPSAHSSEADPQGNLASAPSAEPAGSSGQVDENPAEPEKSSTPEIPEDELRALLGAGVPAELIDEMNPSERAAAIDEAQQARLPKATDAQLERYRKERKERQAEAAEGADPAANGGEPPNVATKPGTDEGQPPKVGQEGTPPMSNLQPPAATSAPDAFDAAFEAGQAEADALQAGTGFFGDIPIPANDGAVPSPSTGYPQAAAERRKIEQRRRAKAERAANARPLSLIEFLTANGGVRDDGGELKNLGLHKHFGRGGRLVRKSGMSLDEARQIAVDAGYLNDRNADRGTMMAGSNMRPGSGASTTTIADLLTALEREWHLKKPIYAQGDEAAAEEFQNRNKGEDPGQREHEIRTAILNHLDEAGVPPHGINPTDLDRAVELVDKHGLDMDHALERAAVEGLANEPETAHTLAEAGIDELPGFDDEATETDQKAEHAPSDGRDAGRGDDTRPEGEGGNEEPSASAQDHPPLKHSTPGTRGIEWSNLREWIHGAQTIRARRNSAKTYEQEDAHWAELAKVGKDLIAAADADTLRTFRDFITTPSNAAWAPPTRGQRRGTTWEALNQAVTDRMAQAEKAVPQSAWDVWWNDELKTAGRDKAIKAAGITNGDGSPKKRDIQWNHLTGPQQAALQDLRNSGWTPAEPKAEQADEPSFLKAFTAEQRARFDAANPANRDVALKLGAMIDSMADAERAERLRKKLDQILKLLDEDGAAKIGGTTPPKRIDLAAWFSKWMKSGWEDAAADAEANKDQPLTPAQEKMVKQLLRMGIPGGREAAVKQVLTQTKFEEERDSLIQEAKRREKEAQDFLDKTRAEYDRRNSTTEKGADGKPQFKIGDSVRAKPGSGIEHLKGTVSHIQGQKITVGGSPQQFLAQDFEHVPTTEPGADGKPQTVIPGTEHASADELKARADKEAIRKKQEDEQRIPPKTGQKDTSGLGLFGPKEEQTDLLDAKPEPKKAGQIGENPFGQPVFEDERGVRSYVADGIRLTEKVGIRPGGGFIIDKTDRSDAFKTTDEVDVEKAVLDAMPLEERIDKWKLEGRTWAEVLHFMGGDKALTTPQLTELADLWNGKAAKPPKAEESIEAELKRLYIAHHNSNHSIKTLDAFNAAMKPFVGDKEHFKIAVPKTSKIRSLGYSVLETPVGWSAGDEFMAATAGSMSGAHVWPAGRDDEGVFYWHDRDEALKASGLALVKDMKGLAETNNSVVGKGEKASATGAIGSIKAHFKDKHGIDLDDGVEPLKVYFVRWVKDEKPSNEGAKNNAATMPAEDSDETVDVTLTAKGPWDFNDTWPAPDYKLLKARVAEGRIDFGDDEGGDPANPSVEQVTSVIDESLMELTGIFKVMAEARRQVGIHRGLVEAAHGKLRTQFEKRQKKNQTFLRQRLNEAKDHRDALLDVFSTEAANAIVREARQRAKREEELRDPFLDAEDPAGPNEDAERGGLWDRDSLASKRAEWKARFDAKSADLSEAMAARFFPMGTGFRTILEARKFAKERGVEDVKAVEETLELAIVKAARAVVETSETPQEAFDHLVWIYSHQPKLGTRTSTSMRDQAYSTPVPLAYIASELAGISHETSVLEPTAGNGALLIGADPTKTTTNEINGERAKNLSSLGFRPTGGDASATGAFDGERRKIDVVIANPPFGPVKENGKTKRFDLSNIQSGYSTNEIDHVIALRALEAMKDDGRAVLIIGSVHPNKDRADSYRAKAKTEFFLTLFKNYNVTDHFTVDGQLYERQGAGWPVDVIVIEGRGKTDRPLPSVTPPPVLSSWGELKEKLDDATRNQADNAATAAPGEAPSNDAAGDRADASGRRPSAGQRGGRSGTVRSRGGAGAGQSGRGAGSERAPSGQPGGTHQPSSVDEFDAAFEAGQAEADQAQAGTLFTRLQAGLPEGFTAHPAEYGRTRVEGPRGYGMEMELKDERDLKAFISEAKKHGNFKPGQRTKRDTRPTADVAKSAATNAVDAADTAMSALTTLFNSKGRPGEGLSFDEETWAKAKPLFIAAAQKFKEFASDVAELIRRVVVHMRTNFGLTREGMTEMKPYLRRFNDELQAGTITLDDKPAAPKGVAQRETTETEGQVTYNPAATKAASIGTLVPVNMKDATQDALNTLRERVGDIENYVAGRLDYKSDDKGPFFIDGKGKVQRPFAAEQLDALALAIDNMERGAGFIIGDQTGIGKGRVNAGVMRYAIEQGKIPLFVTKDPSLFKDIYRDLVDIGMREYLGREPRILATNADLKVALDDEGHVLTTKPLAQHDADLRAYADAGSIGDYDFVATTYHQIQAQARTETARQRFLMALAPNTVQSWDESHNAGSLIANERESEEAAANRGMNRAEFSRALINAAHSVFYSSATYAKRPDMMDLYSRTDMRLAVDNIEALGQAIAEGGVPMQQVVAAMLAQAGQYVRRERSFHGVAYDPVLTPVDEGVYNNFSLALSYINDFSNAIEGTIAQIDDDVKADGERVGHDNAAGKPGVDSMTFTSIMHNIIDQMLLSINAKPAADQAIAALKRGEKPLIALSKTNESFLKDYASDMGLKKGDAVDIDMSQMLDRYQDDHRLQQRHARRRDPQSVGRDRPLAARLREVRGPAQAAHDYRPGRGQRGHPHANAGAHPPHRPGGDAALHPAHPGHSGGEAPGCRAREEDGVAERQHDLEPQECAERRERHRLHERVRRSRRRPRHARRARA
jgi:hypothetical protein